MSVEVAPLELGDAGLVASTLAEGELQAQYGITEAALCKMIEIAQPAGDCIQVAWDGETPIGLALGSKRGGFGRSGYLKLLLVAEAHQNRGIGKRLLQAFEAACEGPPGGFMLLVSEANRAAQKRYEAWGYALVGRLPSYVLADVTELLMYKSNIQRSGYELAR